MQVSVNDEAKFLKNRGKIRAPLMAGFALLKPAIQGWGRVSGCVWQV